MKKTVLILVSAIALVAGGVFLGQQLNKKPDQNPSTAEQSEASPQSTTVSSSATTQAGSKTSTTKRDNSWSQLAEKYGNSRTKLSKKVTEDMSKLLTDAMELADMGAKMSGSADAKTLAAKAATDAISSQLGLTPEQLEKIKPIVEGRVAERMNAVTELAGAMDEDPAMMMETILAGDALARKEITQEEYDAIAQDTLSILQNVGGVALGGRGGNDLADPILTEQLNGMLTPEQQQTLAKLAQEATAAADNSANQMPFQNGNLPVMELEKLDATMVSAQKLTTGIRGMMEGFQGMKDAFPQATEEK